MYLERNLVYMYRYTVELILYPAVLTNINELKKASLKAFETLLPCWNSINIAFSLQTWTRNELLFSALINYLNALCSLAVLANTRQLPTKLVIRESLECKACERSEKQEWISDQFLFWKGSISSTNMNTIGHMYFWSKIMIGHWIDLKDRCVPLRPKVTNILYD